MQKAEKGSLNRSDERPWAQLSPIQISKKTEILLIQANSKCFFHSLRSEGATSARFTVLKMTHANGRLICRKKKIDFAFFGPTAQAIERDDEQVANKPKRAWGERPQSLICNYALIGKRTSLPFSSRQSSSRCSGKTVSLPRIRMSSFPSPSNSLNSRRF